MRWPTRISTVKRCADRFGRFLLTAPAFSLVIFSLPHIQVTNGIWSSLGGNPQHQALSHYRAQSLQKVVWSRKIDFNPQYSGNDLLTHYGSPIITRNNTVVVPIKIGVTDGFRVDGYRGSDGLRMWSLSTDYSLPAHDWTPSLGISIVGSSQIAIPGSGGTVYVRSNGDTANASVQQLCFYGINLYRKYSNWADLNVKICTPITSDAYGNMWFGYRVTGSPPAGLSQLKSGIAYLSLKGAGTYISSTSAAADPSMVLPLMNCAPALSMDGTLIYTAVRKAGGSYSAYGGALLALNSKTLAPVYHANLYDPFTHLDALMHDDGTASPVVSPDGEVFFGILENPFGSNNLRGWLLHFDQFLNQNGDPGAFGWDDTPSIVPSYVVRGYAGTSQWLVCTKYNNYGVFGDGHNKIAILDPFASSIEPVSGQLTMSEVQTVLGVTPDPSYPNLPGAVREWCINSTAIDPYSRCAIVNSEDGSVYRWDFDSGTLSEALPLTAGIGEAYTPTVIGGNGMVFAINNATLFAIGNNGNP